MPIKNAQPHRIVVVVIITITVRHRENDLNDHYSLILFHAIQKLEKIYVLFLCPTILYGRLQSRLFRSMSMQKRPKKIHIINTLSHMYLSTHNISLFITIHNMLFAPIIISKNSFKTSLRGDFT